MCLKQSSVSSLKGMKKIIKSDGAMKENQGKTKMGSYDYGKTEIVEWVKENFPKGSTCLDVGACDGKWAIRGRNISKRT